MGKSEYFLDVVPYSCSYVEMFGEYVPAIFLKEDISCSKETSFVMAKELFNAIGMCRYTFTSMMYRMRKRGVLEYGVHFVVCPRRWNFGGDIRIYKNIEDVDNSNFCYLLTRMGLDLILCKHNLRSNLYRKRFPQARNILHSFFGLDNSSCEKQLSGITKVEDSSNFEERLALIEMEQMFFHSIYERMSNLQNRIVEIETVVQSLSDRPPLDTDSIAALVVSSIKGSEFIEDVIHGLSNRFFNDSKKSLHQIVEDSSAELRQEINSLAESLSSLDKRTAVLKTSSIDVGSLRPPGHSNVTNWTKELRRMVDILSAQKNKPVQDIWRKIYVEYGKVTGVNIVEKAKNAGYTSAIKFAQVHNLVDDIYAVAFKKFF